MIDRPLNQIRDLFRENNKINKELLKFVFEKSDSISLWIIGLSLGGISILATNITHLKQAISAQTLHYIILSLVVSIISGIAYRIVYLYFFVVLNHITDAIDISFSRQKTMDTTSCLSGNETFDELLVVLQNGQGYDFTHLLPSYIDSTEDKKKILYDSLVNHYLNSVEFAKKDTELAIDFVADTYSKFTGTSKEKYLKSMSSNTLGRTYKRTLRITAFFYILYILSFIIALFLFAFAL